MLDDCHQIWYPGQEEEKVNKWGGKYKDPETLSQDKLSDQTNYVRKLISKAFKVVNLYKRVHY